MFSLHNDCFGLSFMLLLLSLFQTSSGLNIYSNGKGSGVEAGALINFGYSSMKNLSDSGGRKIFSSIEARADSEAASIMKLAADGRHSFPEDGFSGIYSDIYKEIFFEDGTGVEERHLILLITTLVIVWIIWTIFTVQATRHFTNWRLPDVQKHYIRIIFLAPIEALTAWCTILDVHRHAVYASIAAVYEAYVLICFAYVMMNYRGGFERLWNPEALAKKEGFYLCSCCALFSCSAKTSLSISIIMTVQFLVVHATGLFWAIVSDEATYHEYYILAGSLSIASMFISLAGLLNIYLLVGGFDALRVGSKLLVLKFWVALIVWQDVILYILESNNTISSLYCNAVRVCHEPDHPSYHECCIESTHIGSRTIAMVIVVEMLMLSLSFIYVFSPNDKGLDAAPQERESPSQSEKELIVEQKSVDAKHSVASGADESLGDARAGGEEGKGVEAPRVENASTCANICMVLNLKNVGITGKEKVTSEGGG